MLFPPLSHCLILLLDNKTNLNSKSDKLYSLIGLEPFQILPLFHFNLITLSCFQLPKDCPLPKIPISSPKTV